MYLYKNNGTRGFPASFKTLSLNCSQDSSLFV